MNQEQQLMSRSLGDHLNKYIQKIEALEEEKSAIMAAIKDAFQEAKDDGVDIKALKELLKMRKMEAMDIQEQQSTLRQYMQALGMYPN